MATETIDLVDELVKAKIPKRTATKLVDYIEKHQSEKTNFKLNIILWALGLVFTFLFSLMIYLHNDLKSDINKLETRINKKLEKIENLLRK